MPSLFTAIILFQLLLASVAAGEESETRHFTIIFHPDDTKIAEKLRNTAEHIRLRIVADLGADFPGKTTVIISPTIEDFQRQQPERAWTPLWSSGVAYPERNLMILRSPRAVKRGHIDLIQVFSHELTHIALEKAVPDGNVPAWLAEGLAMYEAEEWDMTRSASVVRAVLTGRLIPLRDLSFPADARDAELSYAESFMFVSFLINHAGAPAFQRFLLEYSRSGDLEGSLLVATGRSVAEIEEQWIRYLKLRISWIPVVVSATTLWFLATMVFIYGYVRKRSISRATARRWEIEEAMKERQQQVSELDGHE